MEYRKIISLDLSLTSTGVCLYENNGVEVYNTQTIKTKLKGLDRQIYLSYTLNIVINGFEPELAIIEGLGFNTKNTSKEFSHHLNVDVRLILHKQRIPFKLVPPATLKKWVTGNGRADKQLMVDTCNSKYGTNFTLKENDLADAYLLVKWGLNNA